MKLKETVKKIIDQEDRRDPLTDKQIAQKLNVSREKITLLRSKLKIPTSKERLRPVLSSDIKDFLVEKPDLSIRSLTKKLKNVGYNVSRYLVTKELETLDIDQNEIQPNKKKTESDSKLASCNDKQTSQTKDNPFKKLIGYKGSLKSQVQQAKAAILYPPYGLHTLIVGESGVGKSYLAKLMHEFATFETEVKLNKFISFNCADYAENPQLLYSHLFGHVEGAFTGADKNKQGLIEKADGGLIFLDEIHRLPAEGQEMLFSIIDNGNFRRLGETETERKVDVMIVGATTEEIESYLLSTFRRRIPMIIELPPLDERKLEERLEFLELIIRRESSQIDKTIVVDYEAGRALLNYTPSSNIGQLESDLKVICAKAYLEFVTGNKEQVEINLDILPPNVTRCFFDNPIQRKEISNFITSDLVIQPKQKTNLLVENDHKSYGLLENIYEYIETKNQELQAVGISQQDINQELVSRIENKLKRLFTVKDIKQNDYLLELVGEDLVKLVDEVLEFAQQKLPELVLKPQLKYALAIHLNTALERIRHGNMIVYPNLEEVKKEYNKTFEVAKKVVEIVNDKYKIQLPEDEAGYLAMYLNTVAEEDKVEINQTQVGIIVVSHGKVASNMLEVANLLLGGSNAQAVDMDLEDPPKKILDKLIEIAKEVDQGRGILLLVDMGSLVTLGEVIEEKTGIEVKVVPRVDTVMLMEAIRWSMLKNMNPNEIIERINKAGYVNQLTTKTKKKILIFCITGEGTACKVKDYLLHRIPQLEEKFEVITKGFINENLDKLIAKLTHEDNLVSVIGNLAPRNIVKDKFFSIERIFTEKGLDRFKKLIGVTGIQESEIKLESLIDKKIIFPRLKIDSKEKLIEKLSDELLTAGVVRKTFLSEVKRREEWGTTYIGSGIAVPHTDPKHVNYSQIALAVLDKPISWSKNSRKKVEIVCMLAIKDLGVNYFNKLYQRLVQNVEHLKQNSDIDSIKEVLVSE